MIETLADLALRGGKPLSGWPEQRSTLAEPESWMVEWAGGTKTAAGEFVGPSNALSYPAHLACVRILAEVESSLPLHVYRSTDAGQEKATGHYAYSLLHDEPNPEMSAALFRLYMRQNRATWGNGYALPEWNSAGRLRAIWPLRPDWMTVYRNTNGARVYDYQPAFGPRGGKYLDSEIIHVRGIGDDLIGYSPIRLMRESIGLGKAAERFGASFFRNGARFGGVLQVAGKLKPGSEDQVSKEFDEKFSGAVQTGRSLVIDQGSKWTPTTIPPDDAQFLQTRQFQRSEFAAVHGVPPHLIGDTEKSTSWGSGIEQMGIGFMVYTVNPSLVLTEQEYNRKILGGGFYCKHSVAGMMRGDAASRAAFYIAMVQNGIMDSDEVRELEELNRRGGGAAKLRVQSQNIPLDDIGKVAPPVPTQQG